jgi:peptide-methionine (S)-S-oxide reductase
MNDTNLETATLAGGCFWCLEAVYDDLKGVVDVESGYSGGEVVNPSYQEVCGGGTGHAEVVQIRFDPSVITFRDLLDVFFTIHDPTTPNRQGADIGTQYRSAIFYHNDAQRETAEQLIKELDEMRLWDAPIVTEVKPIADYYAAEGYHQEYFKKNPGQGYCQMVVAPKVSKFRKKFLEKLKA